MGNILKHSANLLQTAFLPQQQILNRLQRSIYKVIPCAGVAVQHRWCLDVLLTVRLAALTLESVMRIRGSVQFELKEFTETIESEVAFDIFSRIDDTGGQRLFMRLTLEDLLFYGPGCNEAVYKTYKVSKVRDRHVF